MRHLVLSPRRLIGLTVWLLVLGGWFVALRPVSLGGPVDYLVIRGDSMVPTYLTGDLVIVRAQAAYRVGDIVAYGVPSGEIGAGRLVIHRLVAMDPAGGFVVQGDNNPAPDPWHPATSDIVGRAWMVIPAVGRVMAMVRQPAIAAALAVALVAAFAAWRGNRRPAPDQGSPLIRETGVTGG